MSYFFLISFSEHKLLVYMKLPLHIDFMKKNEIINLQENEWPWKTYH